MSEAKVCFEGRPTGPEVETIKKAVPIESLLPGVMVEYEKIVALINEDRKSSRFKTVVSAWRRWLWRNSNLLLDAVPNVGFVVLDPAQRIDHSTARLKGGVRRIRKASSVAAQTPDDSLSEEEKRTRTFNMVAGGSILAMYKTERKKLAYKVVSVTEQK